MPLRRGVGGLGKAILILLGVAAIGFIIQAISIPSAVDSARDVIAGRIDEDQFNEDLAPFSLAGLLTGATFIALIVLTMIWLYRIAANHRAIGRQLTWVPGWAIGGWFLPPLVLYIIPMLMFSESWKAADPDAPPGDDRWRQNSVSPLVYVWWVLYGLVPILFIVQGVAFDTPTFNQDAQDVAERSRISRASWSPRVSSGLASSDRIWAARPHAHHAARSPDRRVRPSLSIYVVRHGKAGHRQSWDGDGTRTATDQGRPPPGPRPSPTGSPTPASSRCGRAHTCGVWRRSSHWRGVSV